METETIEKLLHDPQKPEDLGIPQNILIDILLRLLYNEGNVNFSRISQVMRVPLALEPLLEWLRQEHIIETMQTSASLGPFNYIYKLTAGGTERARDALERSQYVGPVPVPVDVYVRAMELQTQQTRNITMEQMNRVLSDLVLPSDFHRRLGPAVNFSSSLFLYGPSGNGKTTIARKISSLIALMPPIWIPYALTAGGQIIQIHDRLFHTPVPAEQRKQFSNIDGRWGLFQRPSVTVGGELKMEALDLRFDTLAKIYEAPLQLKANGGMFLIDDFGRQQITPIELLNRWIVPLESGIDFLRLRSGQTIVVPFRSLIIFSTNLDPYELADDAFYRRIQMKVGVFSPNEERFRQIFLKVCDQLGMPFDEPSYLYLLDKWYQQPGRLFQAVHPRDLLNIVQALCLYEGVPLELNTERIDEACHSYFVTKG